MPARGYVVKRQSAFRQHAVNPATVPVAAKKKKKLLAMNLAQIGDAFGGRTISPEMRAKLKQRNVSAITLFLTDWKLQTFQEVSIVPDPSDEIGAHVRYFTDLNMFLYVIMLTLVMLNLNVGGYLLFFLQDSFVAQEGSRFLSAYSLGIFNIWTLSGVPFGLAAILTLALAYHEPRNWTRRCLKLVILFRYAIVTLMLLHMAVTIVYWAWNLKHVPEFVNKRLWETFDLYISDDDKPLALDAKKIWEFTQNAFECCGVNSYRDFLNTRLEEPGAQICVDSDCKTTYKNPIIVKAYPMICCDTTRNKICVTGPRADQAWPKGCKETTVTWIRLVIGLMLAISSVNLVLGVVTTIFFATIDRYSYGFAHAGQVDVEEGYEGLEESDDNAGKVFRASVRKSVLKPVPTKKAESKPKLKPTKSALASKNRPTANTSKKTVKT